MSKVGRYARVHVTCTPLLLVLTFLAFKMPVAVADPGIEFGVDVQSAWTSEAFLQNPTGWDIHASKALSRKTSLRISYSDLSNEKRYRGDLMFGLEQFDSSLHNLILKSDAGTRYYELTLNYEAAEEGRLQLDLGAGVGLARMRVRIADVNSTRERAFSAEGAIGTVIVNLSVNRLFRTPVALRMGYQYRTAPRRMEPNTDDPNPMGNPSLSSVRIGLLARL